MAVAVVGTRTKKVYCSNVNTAQVEQRGISWTTSENETSLITPHFSTNTCVHLASSPSGPFPEASVELMIWHGRLRGSFYGSLRRTSAAPLLWKW